MNHEEFYVNLFFKFDEKHDRFLGSDLIVETIIAVKDRKTKTGYLYGILKDYRKIEIRPFPDFDSWDDASPVEVCPDCHRHDFFNTEWGLWCPNCRRDLEEKELIYE